MRFIKRAVTVEAVQWDAHMSRGTLQHPADLVEPYPAARFHDYVNNKCHICGKPMSQHGWADVGGPICDGDYVYLTHTGALATRSKAEFESEYEPLSRSGRE